MNKSELFDYFSMAFGFPLLFTECYKSG